MTDRPPHGFRPSTLRDDEDRAGKDSRAPTSDAGTHHAIGTRGANKTLASYVRELAPLPHEAQLERLSCPVLVELGDYTSGEEQDIAFRTVPPAVSGKSHRGVEHCEVLLVQKRATSAFRDLISVGRTPHTDIHIESRSVSKFHAYFSRSVEGSYQIADKDSTNGTYVSGVRCVSGVPVLVQSGVEIRFGNHAFRFMTQERFCALLPTLARRWSK